MTAKHLASAILLTLTIAGCAASQDQRGNDLAATLADARANPEKRLTAEVACERAFTGRGGDFPFQAFSAGLLNVAEKTGDRAFCAGLVEAFIAGDLSQSELDAFKTPSEVRGRAAVGTLLRAVLVAHERLNAQQAQKPPQAQSCGCGQ
jgi:hypothetical protein